MKLFNGFSAETLRTEPLLWIRRLVIYERLEPATTIRDVPLHPGMNIIWGIEAEGNGDKFTPGHGVGKTTFCRLIRYCLGEARFGQEHVCREVRNTFSDGYVAAEIIVNGETWSVLRPFNTHRPSFARRAVTVDELVADRGPAHSFGQFRDHVAAASLDGVPFDGALTTGGNILWDHLLAMCSRDQEARYQSIWQWRTARSDSGTPAFPHPRQDALLCVRAVLGLLAVEETSLRRNLRESESRAANLEKQIAERQREPEYWVRHYRRQLRDDFQIAEAEVASLDAGELLGLPNLVASRAAHLEARVRQLSDELDALERQISIASAALQEPAELREQVGTAAEATEAGTTTLLDDVREIEALRQMIRDAEFAGCKYGRLPIGECSYAQEALANFDEQIRQARQANVPEAARREQTAAALQEQRERLGGTIRRLQEQLMGLIERRRELEDDRRRAADDARAVRRSLQRLQEWEEMRAGRVEDSELHRMGADREDAESAAATTRQRLEQLLEDQNARAQEVRTMYDALVKRTLSSDFNGVVEVGQDDLVFRIVRGESMSGEAFETLAILLSDLTVLFLGSLGKARHPGLLLHDSPREADLGATIYRRFLECVADAQKALQSRTHASFQYIVTTTTEPPNDLRGDDTTSLRLGGEHGLLFRQQLVTEPFDPQQSLLPEDSDE